MRSRSVLLVVPLLALAACGQSSASPATAETTSGHVGTTTVPVKQAPVRGDPLSTTPSSGTAGGGGFRALSTRPVISPLAGGPTTQFVVSLTVRALLGGRGAVTTEYRVLGNGPPRRGCDHATFSTVTGARVRQRVGVTLRPSWQGWCRGRWRGEVVLESGPLCSSASSGALPPRCPKLASRIALAGRFTWHVR
jgi:hypothetical protein